MVYSDDDSLNTIVKIESSDQPPTLRFINSDVESSIYTIAGDIYINSNSADGVPDIIIQPDEVGIGIMPNYALDVNGELKASQLYLKWSTIIPNANWCNCYVGGLS